MKDFFTSTISCMLVPICYMSHPIGSHTAAIRIEPPIKKHSVMETDHVVR